MRYYLIVCGCDFQSFFYHVSDVLNSYIMDKISSDSYPPKVPYNYLINMLRIINGLFQMQNGSVRGQTCINVDKQFYDNQQMWDFALEEVWLISKVNTSLVIRHTSTNTSIKSEYSLLHFVNVGRFLDKICNSFRSKI